MTVSIKVRCFGREVTVLYELLQVVWVASQLEDERRSSDLLLDVLVQQLHVLVDVADVRLLVQLEEKSHVKERKFSIRTTAHAYEQSQSYLYSCVRRKVSRRDAFLLLVVCEKQKVPMMTTFSYFSHSDP